MRSSFDLSNLQRIQASLPVREGGLGCRVCNRLNFMPFFASAASTLSLQDDVLTECAQIPIRATFLQSYLAVWSTKFGDVRDTLPTKSHSGITLVCRVIKLIGLGGSQSGLGTPSGISLNCFLSIASWRLKLDNKVVSVAVSFRLGLHPTSVPMRFTS